MKKYVDRYAITPAIDHIRVKGTSDYGKWCRAEEVEQLEMRYAELESEYVNLKAKKENERLEEEYDAICEHVMNMYSVMCHMTNLGSYGVYADEVIVKAEKAIDEFENDPRLNASVLIDETYGEN